MRKTKILFHIVNTVFVILYVYPGSIFGFLIYRNLNKQPQLTSNFFFEISSNHVYAFLVLSLVGFLGYYKSSKIIILNYLILI